MNDALHPLTPGAPVHLADHDPNGNGGLKRADAEALTLQLGQRMSQLQERLYAEGKQSLLVVLQAMDAGGKDGTVKKVFDALNPAGVRVTSFKVPTAEELARDFLWRIHREVPAKGMIGIFNRSHYEDVLVVRVNNLVPPERWEKHYDHINAFERLLTDTGTRVIKFFLHISRDEQKARLEERLRDPEKQWKFSMGDLPVRQQWDDYMRAFEVAIERCNTPHAPWYIVPANRKWYRNYVVSKVIVETLEAMNPQFPPPPPGLDSVVIPD